jgi:hypothetical protein
MGIQILVAPSFCDAKEDWTLNIGAVFYSLDNENSNNKLYVYPNLMLLTK